MTSQERPLRAVPDAVDGPPPSAFDEFSEEMWALPANISSEPLRNLHRELVSEMRRDVSTMPMGAMHAMLLERVAFYYILIRWHESQQSWPTSRERLATYKLWRDLSADFHAAAYNRNLSAEDLRKIIATHTAKLAHSVIKESELGQADKGQLMQKFALAIQNVDLAG